MSRARIPQLSWEEGGMVGAFSWRSQYLVEWGRKKSDVPLEYLTIGVWVGTWPLVWESEPCEGVWGIL